MMDVSILYNKFEFIGNEFLTWLLFIIKNNEDYLDKIKGENTLLELGNCVVMENTKDNFKKTVIIKNDCNDLKEGMICLRMGALVSKINLIYTNDNKDWKFTLKGKDLNFISLKVQNDKKIKGDIEDFFLGKIDLYDKVFLLLTSLFEYFIKLRISNKWVNETVISMKDWINSK